MDALPKRLTGAVVSWTGVVCMGVARTFLEIDGLLIWAMLTCCVGLVCTGWLVVEHVVERVARRVVAELTAQDEWHLDRVADRLVDALEHPAPRGGSLTRLR